MKNKRNIEDIKPYSPVRAIERDRFPDCANKFPVELVCALAGMSSTFVKKVVGHSDTLTATEVLGLLDQDAYGETFVPRSRVLEYLLKRTQAHTKKTELLEIPEAWNLHEGNAYSLLDQLVPGTVDCVVTSPPYWGTRIYDEMQSIEWGDGETCPYGHEQTPEAYVRHTVELLYKIKQALSSDGSIWWNVMDTFNTRTQIRSNAAEALRAMQGRDNNSWHDHESRRYSAGHAFLKDGEQCSIPARISERASRIGLYVKSIVTWAKTGALPEPQNSRVSRNLEYVLHLTKQRTPHFDKEAFRTIPPRLGGRGPNESDRLIDVWFLSTSAGKDGHGAQFALALPGRCIAISAKRGGVVLDPFVGGGTSGVAALELGCRFLGFDVSRKYLAVAESQLSSAKVVTLSPRVASARQQELIPFGLDQ